MKKLFEHIIYVSNRDFVVLTPSPLTHYFLGPFPYVRNCSDRRLEVYLLGSRFMKDRWANQLTDQLTDEHEGYNSNKSFSIPPPLLKDYLITPRIY